MTVYNNTINAERKADAMASLQNRAMMMRMGMCMSMCSAFPCV